MAVAGENRKRRESSDSRRSSQQPEWRLDFARRRKLLFGLCARTFSGGLAIFVDDAFRELTVFGLGGFVSRANHRGLAWRFGSVAQAGIIFRSSVGPRVQNIIRLSTGALVTVARATGEKKGRTEDYQTADQLSFHGDTLWVAAILDN